MRHLAEERVKRIPAGVVLFEWEDIQTSWSAFAIPKYALDLAGPFDENFFPSFRWPPQTWPWGAARFCPDFNASSKKGLHDLFVFFLEGGGGGYLKKFGFVFF